MKWLIKTLVFLAVVFSLAIAWTYLNSPIDPIAWEPADNPGLNGDYDANEKLAMAQLSAALGPGPEDITKGPDGLYYAGLQDGRIVRFQEGPDAPVEEFSDTGGRPLGMQFSAQGKLIVADAFKGLLSISPEGGIEVLTDSVDGRKMLFVDDLDIAQDGTVWFSDASARFDQRHFIYDFLEGRPSGRLLSYSPATKQTRVHLDDLFFANGVALGPEDAFVLVNETGTGRIHRLWLSGSDTGQSDLFHAGLPGSPDNLSFNGTDIFWVALPAVRDAQMDNLAGKPLVRKLIAGLPMSMLKPGKPYGFIVGLDLEGQVVANLQTANGRIHDVTSVNQFDDKLYLGSIAMESAAIIDLNLFKLTR